MMAHDAIFNIKRSASYGFSTQGTIPEVIGAIDQELEELKQSARKTKLVNTLGLSWFFAVDKEIIQATKKAIERDEILLTQLSKWYAHDLSLTACN
jgi:hypothetical protein